MFRSVKKTPSTIAALSTLIAATVFASAAPVAQASGLDKLLPHRAVYDLSLSESSDRSGINGMTGRIVYEMTGSKCDGYTTRFRFFTQVQADRKSFTNDQRTTSYESADGKQFTFANQSFLNGQLEQELRGKAERTGDETMISLTRPEQLEYRLGPSIFMTDHVSKLIEAARQGQTFLTESVFDASDNGDQLVDTTAVIGKKKEEAVQPEGEPTEVSGKFAGQPVWPVSVSYFSTAASEGQGERLPVYQVSFLMHESGVSRDLKLRYEDYSLKGELKEIEFLPVDECK